MTNTAIGHHALERANIRLYIHRNTEWVMALGASRTKRMVNAARRKPERCRERAIIG